MSMQWKHLSNSGMKYIIRNVLERVIWWYCFRKHWLKLIPFETSNMVFVNEKTFFIYDILYIIEKVLTNVVLW